MNDFPSSEQQLGHDQYPNTRATVRVSFLDDGTKGFDHVAVISITTGAARVQTFASLAEMRSLADKLLDAAKALEARQQSALLA